MASEKRIRPPTDSELEAMMQDVEFSRTAHGYPEFKGKKLFVASLKQFPGTSGYGMTEDEARAQLLVALREDVGTADQDRLTRLKLVEAHVQFNHRITLKQKVDIIRRAEKAGLSTRQFVLNQCLHAPLYTSDPVTPASISNVKQDRGQKKISPVSSGQKRQTRRHDEATYPMLYAKS